MSKLQDFDFEECFKMKKIIRSLSNKPRKEIILMLDASGNGKMNVTDIHKKLNLPQPIVSRHLSVLRDSNLVNTERIGKEIHYSVKYQTMAELQKRLKVF